MVKLLAKSLPTIWIGGLNHDVSRIFALINQQWRKNEGNKNWVAAYNRGNILASQATFLSAVEIYRFS